MMTRIVVDESTDNAKPHFDFFLPQCQRPKERFLFRAELKKAALRDTVTRANQIARLLVKKNCHKAINVHTSIFSGFSLP